MLELLKKIIRYSLYLALFTPIFVSGAFVFPFVFPKTALFQIFIEIALAAWIFLLFLEPAYRPRFTFLTKTLSLWLVVLFFTSLLGVNFYHSLWSSYERMTGLITLLHYFAFFLILKSFLKTEQEWLNIFNVSILASLIVSVIGFLQKFGALMSPTGNRIAASLGNPSFLAAYLIFNIFLIGFLLYKKWQYPAWRWVYSAALFFELLILFWTVTRGALVGLAVGFFVFIIIFLLIPLKKVPEITPQTFKRSKIILTACLVALTILIVFFVFNRKSLWFQKIPIINNLTAISLEETTAQTRLMAWRMGFDGWRERWLLGWGWENYNVVFNKFYNPKLFPTETWFDRAHNIFLDTVVTGGLVGLLSYLGIFFVIFYILKKSFALEKINFFTAALFSSLFVVYFIQNQFVFDMLHSYLMFFLVLGFIGLIEGAAWPPKTAGAASRTVYKIPSLAQAAVSIGLILAVYFINIKPGLASYYTISALEQAVRNKAAGFYRQDQILARMEKGLKYGTFGYWENSLRAAEYALNMVEVRDKIFDDDLKKVFNLVAVHLEKAVSANVLDARYQYMLGSLYATEAQYFDESKIYLADRSLTKALELNPSKQDLMFVLSQIKMMAGDNQAAEALLKKAVALNDQAAQSHWTLGLYYLLIGNQSEGEKYIARAAVQGYDFNPTRIQQLIRFYDKLSAWNKIVPLYQKLIEGDPNNPQWHASLAATYVRLGDKEKAREEVNKAASLDSTYKTEGEELLKTLK